MNAYELADYLDYKLEDVFPHHQDTIDILRQQADRIAGLEKQNDNYWVMIEILRQKVKASTTPQTKPLSDEEITQIALKIGLIVEEQLTEDYAHDYVAEQIEFARAIEAKVRGQ